MQICPKKTHRMFRPVPAKGARIILGIPDRTPGGKFYVFVGMYCNTYVHTYNIHTGTPSTDHPLKFTS